MSTDVAGLVRMIADSPSAWQLIFRHTTTVLWRFEHLFKYLWKDGTTHHFSAWTAVVNGDGVMWGFA
jgi:hypothetical protein